jgi:AcrR family transcriptional regulator
MSEAVVLNLPSSGKRELTKLQNRGAIMAAARAAFAELGYETATVRDIIRRTNLSVGAFYNYYRSKEEVYEALAADSADRFQPILRAQAEGAADFASYVRGAITAYYHFLLSEHEAWRSSGPAGEAHGPALRPDTPEIQAIYKQVRASIREVLAKEHGPDVDTSYLATAAIAITREVGEQMLERRPIQVEEAVEFAVNMILGGLAALPRRV